MLVASLLGLAVAAGSPGSTMAEAEPATAFPETRAGVLPVTVAEIPGVERRVFRDGRVFLAGQPDREALAHFRELGVTAAVNLRTPEEMADLDLVSFDLPAVVAELGMEYVVIPLNGRDFPYTPAAVDALAEVLHRHRGPVLVFCAGATRVSYLWAAYLVRYLGFDLETAMAHGRAAGIPPSPLEGLLGRPLRLVIDQP